MSESQTPADDHPLAAISPAPTTEEACRVLVVDDEESILAVLSRFLAPPSFFVDATSSGATAIAWVAKKQYDILILDLKMPEMDGLTVLREIKKTNTDLSVIIMTAFGTVRTAVEAMKLGADEYLLKPLQLEALLLIIRKLMEFRRLRQENLRLREELATVLDKGNIIAKSKAMIDILQLVHKVAPLPSTVLVQGESGTGKELIARSIHANSNRASHRFVALNCAVIPINLLESELFGHERGSFTGADTRKIGYFEAANGGTIFLDEISEMALELQVKLLRVLQERRFQRVGGTDEIGTDVRVIASTNRDLKEEVRAGRFRGDLFYRINVIAIRVPPLRERAEDISILAYFFLRRYSGAFGKPVDGINPQVMEILLGARWEGNVRELENVIERAVAVTDATEVRVYDLPENMREIRSPAVVSESGDNLKPFAQAKEEFEREYLRELVKKAEGNIARAARMARVPRPNLYEKLRKHGITKGPAD